MNKTILIVEDEFIVADDLQLTLENASYNVCGIAGSVAEARELIRKKRPSLVLLDIHLKGKLNGIDLAKELKEENIGFVYLSANSNQQILEAAKTTEPYGFLVKPFRERDLVIAIEIAFYRHEHSVEARWRTDMKLQKELIRIQNQEADWDNKILQTVRALQQVISFDCLSVKFKPLQADTYSGYSLLRISYDEYQTIGINELSVMSGLSLEEIKSILKHTPIDNTAGWYNGGDFKRLLSEHPMKSLMARTFGFSSNLVLPLITLDGYVFSLSFFRRFSEGYNSEQLHRLFHVQQSLCGVMNSISLQEKKNALSMIFRLNPGLKEKDNNKELQFEGIVGNSPAILNLMDLINQVAPSNSSVLILGESGTGKELIANCIHNLSSRKSRPFVKVNCAALPASLIESELFGHERGSFTGAYDKRIGKFEKADTGTILLDEIGEMPPDLQVKLLRVLQEKEIEPIGAKAPVKINVRVIAATNRNLEKEVAEGRFRLDLYYRLNVFPVTLPSLRERKEDIPLLATHFMNLYNRKAGKKINRISDKVIKNMMDYSWPGNIRELEHLIERSVLLAKGVSIEEISLPVQKITDNHYSESRIKTIHENERDYIITVLQKCNNKIWGAGGAAELLNLPPSTLKSRMKKLGIKRAYTK